MIPTTDEGDEVVASERWVGVDDVAAHLGAAKCH